MTIGRCTLAAGLARRQTGLSTQVEPLALADERTDPDERRTTAPAVAFVDGDASVVVGDAALARAAEHPERAIRDVVNRVGDAVPLAVGDLDVAAEDLYAAMAEWMLERAIETTGERPERISLTHPPSWGAFRIELVRDALAERGLDGIHLVSEPIAAAQHDALTRQPDPGTAIAIYDLGGTSFDASVLRADDKGRFAIVGAPVSIPGVGGVQFEHEVMAHVLAHATPAPQTAGAGEEGEATSRREAAALRRACADAVATLSLETETSIRAMTEAGPTTVRLVRAEYEAMIEARVGETVDALERAIESSGIAAGDLAALVLVGGAAQAPIVAQQLSAAFRRPIEIADEPQLAGAYGAAALAAELAATAPLAEASSLGVQVDDGAAAMAHVAGGQRGARRATFRSARRRRAAEWRRRLNARGAVIGGAAAATLGAVLVTPAIAFALTVAGPLADNGSRALGQDQGSSMAAETGEAGGAPGPGDDAGEQADGGVTGADGSGGASSGGTSSGGTSSGGTSPNGTSSGDSSTAGASGAPNTAGNAQHSGTGGQPAGDPAAPPPAQPPGGSWNGDSTGYTPPEPGQQPPSPSATPAGEPPATPAPQPEPEPDPETPVGTQSEGDPAP